MDLRKLVESRHREYTTLTAQWQFFADAYDASPLWPTLQNPLRVAGIATVRSGGARYLEQFPLEDVSEYMRRLNRGVYVDIISPAVDLYASTVGQPSSVIAEIPAGWEEMFDDADLQGTQFLSVMQTARTKACVFGLCFVFVDSPKANGELRTQADVQAQGIRPFLRVIEPRDLLNWKLDLNGRPSEVLFRVPVEGTRSLAEGGDEEQIFEYRYWTPQEWFVIVADGQSYKIVDQGLNPIGVVPMSALYHKKVAPFKGDSLIKQAAKAGLLLSNWVSNIDSVLEKQSFSQLCLRSAGTPSELAIGAAKCVHLLPARKDPNSDQTLGEEDLFWRAPDMAPVAATWDSFGKVLQLANHSMGLQPDVSQDATQPESGISRAWKWHDTERRMVQMAVNEEGSARQILDHAALWRGEDTFPGTISYSTRFDLTNLDTDVERTIALQTLTLPPTAKRELIRTCLNKALPSLPADVQNKIDSELNALNMDRPLGVEPLIPGVPQL